MKLVVILETKGGLLDRSEVSVPDGHDDPDEAANLAIHEAIENWILSPGDVIRVEEVRL